MLMIRLSGTGEYTCQTE